MKKQSNTYIILYSTILVVVVAAVLSYASLSLKTIQQKNMEMETMGAILMAIGVDSESAPDKFAFIDSEYKANITESFLVNDKGDKIDGDAFAALGKLKAVYEMPAAERQLPIFVSKEGKYIVPVTGKGLWGPVWGYIALNSDCNTISGAVFDHKGETPGLGAEISTPPFEDQFVGKQIFRDGKFVSIRLTKGVGSSVGDDYAVDAISGGTLTSKGVEAMLQDCLTDYEPFFVKRQQNQ